MSLPCYVPVRILQGFDGYEAGQEFDEWPYAMAEILEQRGLIQIIEQADDEQEVERAEVQTTRKRKR
jgi:hypothetical protein